MCTNTWQAFFGAPHLACQLDEKQPHLTRNIGERMRCCVAVDSPVVDPLAQGVGIEYRTQEDDGLFRGIPVLDRITFWDAVTGSILLGSNGGYIARLRLVGRLGGSRSASHGWFAARTFLIHLFLLVVDIVISRSLARRFLFGAWSSIDDPRLGVPRTVIANIDGLSLLAFGAVVVFCVWNIVATFAAVPLRTHIDLLARCGVILLVPRRRGAGRRIVAALLGSWIVAGSSRMATLGRSIVRGIVNILARTVRRVWVVEFGVMRWRDTVVVRHVCLFCPLLTRSLTHSLTSFLPADFPQVPLDRDMFRNVFCAEAMCNSGRASLRRISYRVLDQVCGKFEEHWVR